MTRRTELLAEAYQCGEFVARIFREARGWRTPAAAVLRRRGVRPGAGT